MNLSEYLSLEWVKSLGCTEPASIALAAAHAATGLAGEIKSVSLKVDTRIYKNCYAVGIPNSGHKTGILWAAALGAVVAEPLYGLEVFSKVTKGSIEKAEKLINAKKISVAVDKKKNEFFIDCEVKSAKGRGRAVIEYDHTNVTLVERNGKKVVSSKGKGTDSKRDLRKMVASLSIEQMIKEAKKIGPAEKKRLLEGIDLNTKIAEHGLSLFPKDFVNLATKDTLTRISTLVCAGVYARMWGETMPVMSLAGAGNRGITVAVALSSYGRQAVKTEDEILSALMLACLITSATTHHLGTLSAVCGCSNAAGIGLSAGLVSLMGGGAKEISLAINNMVGNVTGMICDGAKIGCALKTMTAVDAAFRAASLAMNGVGIPPEDGIVGANGLESLKNLGKIATLGMVSTDESILKIMQEKLSA